MARKTNTFRMNMMAMFVAIVIIQTTVPILGNIPTPWGLEISIISATVSIVTILMGTLDGAVIGGIWGLITFIRAFVWPTSPIAPIVFVNPLVSILPRILIGIFAGMTFSWMMKKTNKFKLSASLTGIVGSLTNTIFVLGFIYLFYRAKAPQLYAVNIKELLPYLLGIIATNGIPEAIFSGIIVPLIAEPLKKVFDRRMHA